MNTCRSYFGPRVLALRTPVSTPLLKMAGRDVVNELLSVNTLLRNLGDCSEADRIHFANRHTARMSVALRKLDALPIKVASDFVTALADSALPVECRASLQTLVASLSSEDCEDGAQDFESITQMLPASFMANSNQPGFSNRLLDLLVRLGFRKGTEKSYREFTLLVMIASDGIDKSLLHSTETRKAMLQSTKKWIKARLTKFLRR